MDDVFRLLDFHVPATRECCILPRPERKRQREFITPEQWEVYFPPELPTQANLKAVAAALRNELSESVCVTAASKNPPIVEKSKPSGGRGTTAPSPSAEASPPARLDYKVCLEAHRANNKKPLLQCVSALSREQHRAFRDGVITAMTTGSPPDSLVDGEMLLDVVHREQMAYLLKWKELIVSCPLCNLARHKAKKTEDVDPITDNEHVCLNHNFLPPGTDALIEAIVQRKAAALSELIAAQPMLSEGSAEDAHRGGAQQLVLHEEHTGTLGEPSLGHAVAEKCTAARYEGETLAAAPPLTAFPPSHKLLLRCEQDQHSENGGQQSVAMASPDSEANDPFAFSVLRDQFDNYLCLSFWTIVDLASCLVPGSQDLRIPILVDDNMSLYLQENCPALLRRRELLEEICLGAIETDQALSLSRLEKVEMLFSLPLSSHDAGSADRRQLLMRSLVWRNNDTDRITIPLIKMEYSAHKAYNVEHDDEAELHLEEFSKRELIAMHLALSLHPQSQVTVFRVNAYTMAVVGVQSLTMSSFLSASTGWSDDDGVLRTAWGTARQVLEWLQGVQVASMLASSSVDHRLVLCSTAVTAGSRTVVLASTTTGPPSSGGAVQVELSSRAVALREYLPPMVWPYSDRIPYTFAPKSAMDEEPISRLKSVRDAKTYAAHDAWSHSSTVFRSSIIGNMSVMTTATKPLGRSVRTS